LFSRTFHDPQQNSMTFQAWKTKIRNSMTFQDFQDPYEPWYRFILGLQSFPREYEDKNMAVMLDYITKISNDKSFVNVLHHGGNDVTCNQRIPIMKKHLLTRFNIWFNMATLSDCRVETRINALTLCSSFIFGMS
jgi:hypothetical protein